MEFAKEVFMKKDFAGSARIPILLIGLAALIALVIVLDSLPVPQTVSQKLSADTLLSDLLTDTAVPETTFVLELPTYAPADSTAAVPETTLPPETTVTAPETEAPVPEKDPNVTLLTFLGACSPGSPMGTSAYGSLNAVAQDKGNSFFFSRLSGLLNADDLTVAANACFFTDSPVGSPLACSAPPLHSEIYSAGGIDFISLSTPHFRETSSDLRAETRSALEEQSVYCADENTVSYMDVNGIRIGLYCVIVEKGADSTAAVQKIRTASEEADYVVVYFWSSDTISSTPEEWLRYILHQFAQAGASLIVGVSEGEIRPIEEYKNCTIAYSLGSLINGASFRTDNISVVLQLALRKNEDGTLVSEISVIPCSMEENRWQPAVLPEGDTKNLVDSFLLGKTDLPLVNQ